MNLPKKNKSIYFYFFSIYWLYSRAFCFVVLGAVLYSKRACARCHVDLNDSQMSVYHATPLNVIDH